MEELDIKDMELLIFIYNRTHSAAMDRIMPVITDMGQIWLIIAIVLLLSNSYRDIGLITVLALLMSKITGEDILKPSIKRLRPFTVMPYLNLLIKRPSSYSFPSGHAASSFAAAGVIAAAIPSAGVPVFFLAGLIAFSRIYLLVHYPSDVIGGAFLGLICAYIALRIGRSAGV